MKKKAVDVQPSNPGTKLRENERDRESNLEEKDEKKVVNRKKIDSENKRQNGSILAWIKSQDNRNSGKKTGKKEDEKELSVSGLAERQNAIITRHSKSEDHQKERNRMN